MALPSEETNILCSTVCAHEGRAHAHVCVLHLLLGLQAERDLVPDRDRERVALERRAVLRPVRLDGYERAPVPAGRGFREGGRAQRGLAGALLGRAPVAGEAPGPVDQDADADPLAVEVADLLDLAVFRRDHLRAAQHDACVGVGRTRAEGRIDSRIAELAHGTALVAVDPTTRAALRRP